MRKRTLDVQRLRVEYETLAPRAERLREALCDQIGRLLLDNDLTLGVPIESRVKSWPSIAEKVERKALGLSGVAGLQDLVGVRVILLFRRDVDTVTALLRSTFDIVSSEDTAARLSETQFGYQSVHYVVRIPPDWLQVPTLSDLGDLNAEIQVRTLAQHIWAAASHKLQYKQEDSVPLPVQRSIHRVSALLETVDLEFERVLLGRASYIAAAAGEKDSQQRLNVDLLASLLAEVLPAPNKEKAEPYADLLKDLRALGVNTFNDLRRVIERHMATIKNAEAREVQRRQTDKDYVGASKERIDSGVFFSHVGLARCALEAEFGKRFRLPWRNALTPLLNPRPKRE